MRGKAYELKKLSENSLHQHKASKHVSKLDYTWTDRLLSNQGRCNVHTLKLINNKLESFLVFATNSTRVLQFWFSVIKIKFKNTEPIFCHPQVHFLKVLLHGGFQLFQIIMLFVLLSCFYSHFFKIVISVWCTVM